MPPVALLVAKLDIVAAYEEQKGALMFLGRPDRWQENPTWRCTKNHVSKMYLKSEVLGNICLGCYSPIFLTFPEDKDGFLTHEAILCPCICHDVNLSPLVRKPQHIHSTCCDNL